jgi:hypothetical protein
MKFADITAISTEYFSKTGSVFLEPKNPIQSQHFGEVSFLILIVQKKDMHFFEEHIIQHHLENVTIKPLPAWLLRKPFSRYYSKHFRLNYEGFSQLVQLVVLIALIFQFFCLLPESIQSVFWSSYEDLRYRIFAIIDSLKQLYSAHPVVMGVVTVVLLPFLFPFLMLYWFIPFLGFFIVNLSLRVYLFHEIWKLWELGKFVRSYATLVLKTYTFLLDVRSKIVRQRKSKEKQN